MKNISHAFYAEYGSGKPVIAVLGEYDALPGLSQKCQITKEPVTPGANMDVDITFWAQGL